MALYGKELQTYHGTYYGNVNQSAADLQAAHATAHGATAHVGSREAIGSLEDLPQSMSQLCR